MMVRSVTWRLRTFPWLASALTAAWVVLVAVGRVGWRLTERHTCVYSERHKEICSDAMNRRLYLVTWAAWSEW